MEIKWYWLSKQLGLVEDISHQYNDGYTHHIVSGNTGDVFLTLFLCLIPALFLLGFLLRFFLTRLGKEAAARSLIRGGSLLLLLYAVFSAIGVGPYIQFYPQGGGFLDFETLEHIVQGVYCALLALSFFLGGWLSRRLSKP